MVIAMSAIREKDIKVLWARSGNRCAFIGCRASLVRDFRDATSSFPIGQMAHIVGEHESSPRGVSPLSDVLRNAYTNLILLCPNHHVEIDKDLDAYPVATLHAMKDEHEAWVEERLAPPSRTAEAADWLYADFVDEISTNLMDDWDAIASGVLSPDPYWMDSCMRSVRSFRARVLKTPWPDTHNDLEISILRLSLLLVTAIEHFETHADWQSRRSERDVLRMKRIYPEDVDSDDEYHRQSREQDQWLDRECALVREAAKCLNWFSDLVRRDLNPYFRLREGYVLTSEGDFLNSYQTLYKYSDEEVKGVLLEPESRLERAKTRGELILERMTPSK
jgi:hypothetical protein